MHIRGTVLNLFLGRDWFERTSLTLSLSLSLSLSLFYSFLVVVLQQRWQQQQQQHEEQRQLRLVQIQNFLNAGRTKTAWIVSRRNLALCKSAFHHTTLILYLSPFYVPLYLSILLNVVFSLVVSIAFRSVSSSISIGVTYKASLCPVCLSLSISLFTNHIYFNFSV